jgi:hypothetical protein
MMRVGTLTIEFRLHGVFSKKEKRSLSASLKQKLRNKFNVAVAEIDALDSLDSLVLSVVTVSNETRRVQSVLSKTLAMIESSNLDEIVDVSMEVFQG